MTTERSAEGRVKRRAQTKFWRNERTRRQLIQLIVFATVAWLFYLLASNTATNLQRQGIASGLGFLDNTAGFNVIQALIPFDESSSYGRAFLVGLVNTIVVAAVGIVLATILGFLVGTARLAQNALLRGLAGAYVEVLRNVPLLLQIFFWYFVVLRALPPPRQAFQWGESIFLTNRGIYFPTLHATSEAGPFALCILASIAFAGIYGAWALKRRLTRGTSLVWWPFLLALGAPFLVIATFGIPWQIDVPHLSGLNFRGGINIIPEFSALLAGLVLYTASYIAEIVRAGILSVAKGQREAALSLGLGPMQTLALIIIPQAMRVIIPPLTSQYLNLIKNSSLAAAIGYPDLVGVFAGTVLNQTGQAVEVIAITMAVYLTTSLIISAFMNLYNRRILLVER